MSLLIKNCALISHNFQAYLVNQIELNKNEREEAFWRRVAFLFFTFFIVLLGLPTWWFSTTPYRAQLPQIGQDCKIELEKRMQSYYMSNDSSDVWNNLEPHSDYILHFIFVHQKFDKENLVLTKQLQRKIGTFLDRYLRPIGINVRRSAEYLWDFSLSDFLHNSKLIKTNSVDTQILTALASELDRLSSPPVEQNPLLKIAIFFDDYGATMQGIQNDSRILQQFYHLFETASTSGFAIASWGGIFVQQQPIDAEEKLLNAVMAVMKLQILPSTNLISSQTDLQKVLESHKERLALQNLLQTIRILNSLHNLASQIEDLVISDEVAEYAAKSQTSFNRAYISLPQNDSIDSESAADARRWASLAIGHHSLLELLNFPSDQKYGVYLPLFFPLFVPLLQPLASFLLFLTSLTKFTGKNRRSLQNSQEEKID